MLPSCAGERRIDMAPDTIGRYKVTREVGRGAMGVVYEAEDPNIGRTVALKTIFAQTIGTNPDEVAQRFKNEARAAGGLSHPNIVTVFDAGEHEGTLYLAMEFLEGETLEQHLVQRRTISPERAIDITRQICAALDFAHAKGIVHRDIKPANVMLLSNGTVKITDFGIARTAEAITMTGQVLGTPHFMSPEQVRGRMVDGRSDMFSVAVMLYEMLTGERPFEGQSITTIMYKIVHENPTPPRALDSSISPGLSAVVEKALSKSPEDRYPSGAALVSALENYKSFNTTIRDLSTAETVNFRPGTLVAPPDTQEVAPPSNEAEVRGRNRPDRGKRRGRAWVPALIVLMVLGIAWYVRSQKGERQQTASTQQETGSQPSNQRQSASGPSAPIPPPAPNSENSDKAAPTKSTVVQKKEGGGGSSTATMKVTSQPPTGEIYLDNKATGMKTPAQIQIPRGEHAVSVKMEGFQPATAKFRVKGGEELEFSPELSVMIPKVPNIEIPKIDVQKLTGLQGSAADWKQWAKEAEKGLGPQGGNRIGIMVNSRPRGARILLNGEDTGRVTPAVIPTQPGTFNVRAEMEGFQPAERDVEVQVGHPGIANFKLVPIGSKSNE